MTALTFTRFALAEPFAPDLFAAAVGQPLPGWVTGSTIPGPGVLTAAEVAWGGWSARLTVELPEPV